MSPIYIAQQCLPPTPNCTTSTLPTTPDQSHSHAAADLLHSYAAADLLQCNVATNTSCSNSSRQSPIAPHCCQQNIEQNATDDLFSSNACHQQPTELNGNVFDLSQKQRLRSSMTTLAPQLKSAPKQQVHPSNDAPSTNDEHDAPLTDNMHITPSTNDKRPSD